MKSLERRFSGWSRGTRQESAFPSFAPDCRGKVYVIDRPGSSQASIWFGSRFDLDDNHLDLHRVWMADHLLGAPGSGRLNRRLREARGLTYGVSTSLLLTRRGPYAIIGSTSVAEKNVRSALQELMSEITAYRDRGVDEAELRAMKQSVLQSEYLQYETPPAKSVLISDRLTFDWPASYLTDRRRLTGEITVSELNRDIKRFIDPDAMCFVVVGDAARFRNDIGDLGLAVVENARPGI